MRIRQLAFSAAFITVLTTSTSLITPAMAQKGRFLEPSTAWAVTKVGKNQGQGSEYCALARRFEEKTIMTMAKNSNSETSFALDFQSAILTAGQSTEVILDPGAGQQRTYSVQPVSEKAFVIRLGDDEEFFQALARTGFLRVDLGSRQYSFNLQDIDVGKSQLEACIAASVMPAAGNMFYDVSAPPEKPAIPAAASSQESEELASLRAEIERLRDKQAEISTLVTASGAEVKKQISDSADTEIKNLKDQLALLQSEKDSLMLELASATEKTQSAIENGASVETVQRLEKENEQLRKMTREFEVRLSEHSALMSEIEGLRKSNSDLRSALDQSRKLSDDEKAGTEALKDAVDTLEIKNAELLAQLETAKAGLMNFAAQVSEIEETKKRNAELTQKIAEAEARQKEFDAAKEKLASLEIEKAKLENTAREIEQKTAMDLQLKQELESSIALLESENNRLQSELQRASQSGAQLDLLTSQIRLLEQENEKLGTKLKDTDSRYQENLAQKDKVLSDLEQKISQLNEEKSLQDQQLIQLSALSLELETLKKQNTELESKLQAASQTEQVVSDLRQQIETLAQGNEGLKQEIEKVRTEKKGEYALQLDKLTAENETLLKQIEEQKAAIAEIESLKADVAALESEKADLLENIKVSDAAQKDTAAKIEALTGANAALRLEVESLAFAEFDNMQKLAEQKSSLQKELDERIQQISALENQIKDQEKQGAVSEEMVKAEIAQREQEIEALKAQISEKSDKIAALESRADDGSERVSQLELELAKAEDSAWQLESALSERDGAISALEKALEQEKESVVALEASLTEKMAYIEPAAAEMQIEEAQAQAAELSKQLEQSVAENARLHSEFEGVRLRAVAMEGELEALRAENAGLSQQVAELENLAGLSFDDSDGDGLADLQAKLEESLAQNQTLRERVAALELAAQEAQQSAPAIAAASPELDALKTENAGLREQLAAYEGDLNAVAQLEESLRQAEMENTKLREELALKTAAIEKLESEKAALIAAASEQTGSDAIQPASLSSGDNSSDLEEARAKIAALEKSLAKSDQEKQRALEDLAESYLKLKAQQPQIQPATMREARADAPLPARAKSDKPTIEDQAPGINPMAGDDRNDTRETAAAQPRPIPQKPSKKAVQGEMLPAPAPIAEASVPVNPPAPPSAQQRVEYTSGDIEAQMYEQQEMEAIRSNERVASARSSGGTQTNVTVRQSEDPFADIKTEDEFSGYSYSKEQGLQEKRGDHAVPAARSRDTVITEPLPEVATAQPASVPQQEQAVSRVERAPSVEGVYHPSFTIEDVLEEAELGSDFNVRIVEKASGIDKAAYEWQAGSVFGTAELSPLMSDAGFEAAVQTYLERTQSRCNGDFAIVPDDTRQMGEMRVDSYEVACVGDGVQASASLLFFNKAGTFAVLTHEASLENMESAMDMRDRIMKTVAGS